MVENLRLSAEIDFYGNNEYSLMLILEAIDKSKYGALNIFNI